jgi:hypothetical protein
MIRNLVTQCAGGDPTSRPRSGQSCEDTHRRDRGSQRDELLYLFRVDVISLPNSPPDR